MTGRLCSIDGCERAHDSLGYCRSHRRRLAVYGDPLGLPEPKPPWEHGTVTGYKNHDCRCDACREAAMAYERRRVVGVCVDCGGATNSRYTTLRCRTCHNALVEAEHGTESRYKRCHCVICRAGGSAARRRRRLVAA